MPEGQCFVIKDTYKYESKGAGIKVVHIITFEYEYNPKNKDELMQRFDKELKNIKQNACVFESNNEMQKQGFKSIEQCRCYVDTMLELEFLAEVELNNEKEQKIDGFIKGLERAEKKCGKLLNTKTNAKKTKKVKKKK